MHARPQTPVEKFLEAVPPAIIVGFLLAVLGGVALDVYQIHLEGLDDTDARMAGWAHSSLASNTLWVTTTVLIAIGLGEASRRAPGGDGGLLLAAAILIGVVALRALTSVYLNYLASPSRDTITASYLWGSRVSFVCWLGASACVAATLRRHPPETAVLLGAGLVIASVLAHPPRFMQAWLMFDWRSKHADRNNAVIGTFLEVAHVTAFCAALVVRFSRLPPLAGNTTRVAAGIGRVGSALVGRVLIAIGFALVMLAAVSIKSVELVKLAFLACPVAALIAMIALITGLFQAAGPGGAPEPPRLRFTLAGAFTLASTIAIAIQAVAAYKVLTHRAGDDFDPSYGRRSFGTIALAFPYLIPAFTLAGMLCLISALASLRRQRGAMLGSADPATAGALMTAFTMAGVLLQHWMMKEESDAGTFLFLLVAVTVVTIAAQLAVARLCHKVAAGLVLDPDTELPTARIHVPE